jgi:rod shape determining protein RodA
MKQQHNKLAYTDWVTILLYILLVAFGWMNIFSVNDTHESGPFFSLSNRYTMQLVWILISTFTILIIFAIDSRFYAFIAYPAYGFGLLILLAVLAFGTTINNSKSWIVIGPISLQPVEFAKTTTVLALSKFLSGYNIKITKTKDIIIAIGIVFLPVLLILAQPDFGSTLVYGVIILILYREGLPGWILILVLALAALFLCSLIFSQFSIIIVLLSIAIVGFAVLNKKISYFLITITILGLSIIFFLFLNHFGIYNSNKEPVLYYSLFILTIVAVIFGLIKKMKGLFLILIALYMAIGIIFSVSFVFHHIMKEHQRNRVNVILGLESDPYGYEYNIRQSKIAIGSGGFAGKGFMQGTQTKFKFVPEQSTDFIFCTVGEEWGFLGCFGLILTYAGLLIRLLYLAERQRSKFSRIYGYGVASILFFHFAVNIGMTIGLFPVIGIPLPFLSYGGSSLLAFTIMLFVFLKLDSTRRSHMI